MIHLLMYIPAMAALLLVFTPGATKKYLAIAGTLLAFIVNLLLWQQGGADTTTAPWVPTLGITYSVGLDGVSLLLTLVTSFMSLLCVLYAAFNVERPGPMLANVLLMESGLLGIFASRDLILFYIFFEATLIPALVMLAIYGGPRRVQALTKFAVYTIIGSLFMLLSMIGVKYYSGAASFALADLLAKPLDPKVQTWLLLGFVAAFSVKLPMFPLHGWLPEFHEENHNSGVPDVMGTLYKVGGYGVFRFALPLFPDASEELRIVLMALAAFTTLYAAWIAFQQVNWKRLLAYAGLSHMGLVALGVFSMNEIATTGALYLLAFQGVYMGALFLAVGMVNSRTGSVGTHFGGLMDDAPVLSGLTMTLWFAAIAVPGLAGFIGEFSVMLGAYQVSPWLAFLAGLSVIAAGAYALTAYQKTYWETKPQGTTLLKDISGLEGLILVSAVVVSLVYGIYSSPAIALIRPTVDRLLQGLGG
ncbi:complex I subunit 4 family protein [Deinococcus roseus]|uniref:NADH dehydrogenase subunit M n=1 Tax=Deinococcus roseus TaxID=392414 RepID=A0ABQ2CTX5_9DEIO|nr:NADH-quinone oxidoreductase subunit M [Deinococcus roseus]GGJ20434.1 NADH dehydrogenase subunit M [Deinococcus roseus]